MEFEKMQKNPIEEDSIIVEAPVIDLMLMDGFLGIRDDSRLIIVGDVTSFLLLGPW